MSMSTASAAAALAKELKPTHEINVKKVDQDAVPDHIPAMNIGETVRYTSGDGEVTIAFPGPSPYRMDAAINTTVPGEVILTLVKDSDSQPNKAFPCRCFLTLKNGEGLGWGKGTGRSGGEHHVRRP
jgi:hypothetical protein